jgi:uncharacterized protein involved in outer membrane biogenesis
MPAWLKRKRVWMPGAAGLALALYAAFGFWWAPRLLHDAIEREASAAMRVPVQVGEVITHPFTFEVTVRDLRVADPAQPLLAWERLYLDFELASLWRRAWSFREVRINGPFARAIIGPDGGLNLAALLPPEPAQVPAEPLPAVIVERLVVSGGRVNFADRSRREQPEKTLAPIQFELAGFRTTPEGGGFTLSAASESGERFDWRGRMSLQPLASQGHFEVRGLKARSVWEFASEQLPFEFTDGEFELAGEYDFRYDQAMQLEATLPEFSGRDLALRAPGAGEDWVRLPALAVRGTRLSLGGKRVEVGEVTLAGARVTAWREPDGSLNLMQLAAFGAAAPVANATADRAEATATTAATDPADAANANVAASAANAPNAPNATNATNATNGDWTLQLARLELADAAVDFTDRALSPAVSFELSPVALEARELSLDLARPVPVRLAATLDGTGTLSAEGTLVPATQAADLAVVVAALPLAKLQPYAADLAAVEVKDGRASAEGRLQLAEAGAAPWLRFEGKAAVADFAAVDRAQRQPLASWDGLDMDGLVLALAPDSLRIARVTARRPFLRAVVSPDQSLNLVRVLSSETTGGSAPAVALPAAAPTAPPMPVRIDEVRVQAATLSFADLFIQPNFQARIESLDGSIRGLSSAPGARARIDLAGFVVNRFSPVTITGELDPFRYDQHTDLALKFSNIDLPVFNPYSGRYAGFAIARGKLSTELQYRIRERRLEAGHHVVLDQLEWGEATDSQDKVSLPIRLATSLLKDRDGVIDLDLPVAGTLDDPSFRVGPVVWQVLKNIVVKIVTAPFAFLGSMFEGAEDAQFVLFTPGESALGAEQQASLAALAQGLAERPQLRITVPAVQVPGLDAPALAERGLAAALAAGEGDDAAGFDLAALPVEEQVERLRDLYRDRFDRRAKPTDPPEPPEDADRATRRALAEAHELAWLRGELLPLFTPDDAALAALAQARAQAIQQALLAGDALAPERVFVTAAAAVAPRDAQVPLELALE